MPEGPLRSTDKVVLVTGASAGIGEALAKQLGRQGCRLALTARRADRLDRLARELRDGGTDCLVLPASLDDTEAPGELVEATVGHFGRLDVLINNAGFGLPGFFHESEPDDLRTQIAVNLTAPILLTRLALPHLIASKGMVINVGSGITSVANPVFGAYGATKAALAWWNDALRREVRHKGVRVCLVEPGPVDTEFFAAIRDRESEIWAKGISPTPDNLYNPLRDRPPRLMTTTTDEAARRIAGLLDRPRRRLSFLRRVIWPMRLVGALFQLAPGLADLALTGMMLRIERELAMAGRVSRRGLERSTAVATEADLAELPRGDHNGESRGPVRAHGGPPTTGEP